MKRRALILLLGAAVMVGGCTDKVCMDGHMYYRSLTGYSMSYTPILDDDGKPVKCEAKP
jgi:hypothetical protein